MIVNQKYYNCISWQQMGLSLVMSRMVWKELSDEYDLTSRRIDVFCLGKGKKWEGKGESDAQFVRQWVGTESVVAGSCTALTVLQRIVVCCIVLYGTVVYRAELVAERRRKGNGNGNRKEKKEERSDWIGLDVDGCPSIAVLDHKGGQIGRYNTVLYIKGVVTKE